MWGSLRTPHFHVNEVKERDMKYVRLILVIACACVCLTASGVAPAVDTADNIILALSRNKTDAAQLTALKMALFDVHDVNTKCIYGMIYCLGSLATGATDAGMVTRTQMLRAYAGNQMVASALSDASISDECRSCGGRGEMETQCATCRGSGACTACRGTGKRTEVSTFSAPICPACGGQGTERYRTSGYKHGRETRLWRHTGNQCMRCGGTGKLGTSTVSCLTCRGSSKCRTCGGSGRGRAPCNICNGTRYVLSPRKCDAAYQALLARTAAPLMAAKAQAEAEKQVAMHAESLVAASEVAKAHPRQEAVSPILVKKDTVMSPSAAGQEQVAAGKKATQRYSFSHSMILLGAVAVAMVSGTVWLIKKVV